MGFIKKALKGLVKSFIKLSRPIFTFENNELKFKIDLETFYTYPIENYETKINETKDQASQIINEAKESALQASEKLIKETEDKIQSEIKKTEERVALEKKQALIDLEDQLKDSATSFLGKITNLNKEDIKI